MKLIKKRGRNSIKKKEGFVISFISLVIFRHKVTQRKHEVSQSYQSIEVLELWFMDQVGLNHTLFDPGF